MMGKLILATACAVYAAGAIAGLVTKSMFGDDNAKKDRGVELVNRIATGVCVGLGGVLILYVICMHAALRRKDFELWRSSFSWDTSPPHLAPARYDEENRLLPDARKNEQTLIFANKLRLAWRLMVISALLLVLTAWLAIDLIIQDVALGLALYAAIMAAAPLVLSVKDWCVASRSAGSSPETQPILQPQMRADDPQSQRPLVNEGSMDSNTAIL